MSLVRLIFIASLVFRVRRHMSDTMKKLRGGCRHVDSHGDYIPHQPFGADRVHTSNESPGNDSSNSAVSTSTAVSTGKLGNLTSQVAKGSGPSWYAPLKLPLTPWQRLWGDWHNKSTGLPNMMRGEREVWKLPNATIMFPRYSEVYTGGTAYATFDRLLWVPKHLSEKSWAVNFNQLAEHGFAKNGFPQERFFLYPQNIHRVLAKPGALFRFFRNTSTEARQADFQALTMQHAREGNTENFPRVKSPRGDLWRPKGKKMVNALSLPLLRNDCMGFDVYLTSEDWDRTAFLYEAVMTAAFLDINPYGNFGIPHHRHQAEEYRKYFEELDEEVPKERLERENERMGFAKGYRPRDEDPMHPSYFHWSGAMHPQA